jgi:hypothetical protein
MSIASLVTRGFGNGSFVGTIAEIVTMGYSIGVQIDVIGSLNAALSVSNAYNVTTSVTSSYSFDASVLNALTIDISVK